MNRPPDTLFAVCTQFDRAAAPWNKKVRFFASSIWFCRPSSPCIRIVFKIKSRPTYVFGTAFQYRFNIQSLISAAFGFTIKRSLSGLVCGVLVILTAAACFFFFSPLFLPLDFFEPSLAALHNSPDIRKVSSDDNSGNHNSNEHQRNIAPVAVITRQSRLSCRQQSLRKPFLLLQ